MSLKPCDIYADYADIPIRRYNALVVAASLRCVLLFDSLPARASTRARMTDEKAGTNRLGYLFERFPSFTQTFCAREIAELYRQGVTPPVFSVRRPKDDPPQGIPLDHIPVFYVPNTNSLEFKLKTKLISSRLTKLWSGSGDLRDKGRFREAVYLGPSFAEPVSPISTSILPGSPLGLHGGSNGFLASPIVLPGMLTTSFAQSLTSERP